MDFFPFEPAVSRLESEEGLFASRVQMGSGYAQVSYKGLQRRWLVRFTQEVNGDLKRIQRWIEEHSEFSWTQPRPYEVDGKRRTMLGGQYHSSEIDGELVLLRYEFVIDLIGPQFVEIAEKKYGPRDTGTDRLPN